MQKQTGNFQWLLSWLLHTLCNGKEGFLNSETFANGLTTKLETFPSQFSTFTLVITGTKISKCFQFQVGIREAFLSFTERESLRVSDVNVYLGTQMERSANECEAISCSLCPSAGVPNVCGVRMFVWSECLWSPNVCAV